MKHKIEYKWYVVEILREGKWEEMTGADSISSLTLREAKSELKCAIENGHKTRLLERIAAYRVITK